MRVYLNIYEPWYLNMQCRCVCILQTNLNTIILDILTPFFLIIFKQGICNMLEMTVNRRGSSLSFQLDKKMWMFSTSKRNNKTKLLFASIFFELKYATLRDKIWIIDTQELVTKQNLLSKYPKLHVYSNTVCKCELT